MTRRYFGPLYLVRPDWHGDPDDAHESVVETYRNGRSDIDVALELWRLAGNEEQARHIEKVLDRAYERDRPVLNSTDIDELIAALDGLEPALRSSVLDADGLVPADRIDELRKRTRLLDFDETRGHLAAYAVDEGLSRVYGVRKFLQEAPARGLHVALD